MKMLCHAVVFGALLSLPAAAQTVAHRYTGGENDSVSNGNALSTTIDSGTAGTNLTYSGTGGTYRSSTFGDSSTLAYSFDGTGLFTGAVDSSLDASSSFIMELRFRPTSSTATQVLVYNGNTGSSGIGLYISGGAVAVLRGGGTFPGHGTYSTSSWNYAALVYDQGTTKLFVNASSYDLDFSSFTAPAGALSIAGTFSNGSEGFNGLIDNVKISTFTSGTFTTSMLSYSAVPEPSSAAALAGLTILGLVATRRRRHA